MAIDKNTNKSKNKSNDFTVDVIGRINIQTELGDLSVSLMKTDNPKYAKSSALAELLVKKANGTDLTNFIANALVKATLYVDTGDNTAPIENLEDKLNSYF
jgi:hypothetical protein